MYLYPSDVDTAVLEADGDGGAETSWWNRKPTFKIHSPTHAQLTEVGSRCADSISVHSLQVSLLAFVN